MSGDKRDINLDELENVTTHTCPDCGAIFYSEGALVWHEQTAHGNMLK